MATEFKALRLKQKSGWGMRVNLLFLVTFSYTQQGFTAPSECVHREGCKNEKR